MRPLSRPDFCSLVRLEVPALKTLDRRGQLPFAIDQTFGRGYEAAEAFLVLLAQALVEAHAISVTRAADIAAALPEALSAAWPAVVESGQALAHGTAEPLPEILAGRASAAYPATPRACAGTLAQIVEALEHDGFEASALVLVSASRVLAQLIQRAAKLELELPAELWTAPLRYRPRHAPLTPDELAEALEAAR